KYVMNSKHKEWLYGMKSSVVFMDQLPRQQQDILLYTLKGLKVQEIAVILNISENSVKTQKKRAYLFVRDHFDPVQLHILYFIFCGDRIK
ncbi:MAG: RNA polymerase sigma factor, partial [Odoribacter splanchnicus]